MKRFIGLLVFVLTFVSYLFAQGEVEAGRMSRNDLYGTARGMSMGGAFGALGGDLTGVALNPAGIAVYRSSEVVATADLSQESSKVGDISRDKTSFKMDNLGFVGSFPLRSNTVPFINFGFAYNKVKSFNKKIGAYNGDPASSLMDYMAEISTRHNVDPAHLDFNIVKDPFSSGAPWLSVLGFNSYLINPHQDEEGFYNYTPLHNEAVTNSLALVEKGSVNNYDFTIGTTLGKVVNVGITLSVTDIYYRLSSRYSEEFERGENAGFDLRNYLTTEGAGVGAKIGVIVRPMHELRIGLAYHTPVWCSLTDTYSAEIEDNVTEYVVEDDPESEYEPGKTFSGLCSHDYRFRTPGKWVMSVAGVIENRFIASLDYELTHYQNMKFKADTDEVDAESMYENDNLYISEDYKTTSTVRVGFEYRFTPQFSGRLGYAWMENPYDSEYRAGNRETAIAGSTTIYRIEGDASYFTGGLGYRFSRNFYLDFAIVYRTQKDDLYPYPNVFDDNGKKIIDASPYTLKNNNIKGLLTLGYKF
jgi:long-subunit fatty acid transport protein